MFKNRIAYKWTIGFVVIVLIAMLAIGLFFIQMFKQYAFESREKTMLSNAHSISEVAAEYFQGNSQMRGFNGYLRSLDTLTESNVWLTDSKGNLTMMSGIGQGMGNGFGMGQGPGNGLRQGAGAGLRQGSGNGLGQGFWKDSEPLPTEAENAIQEVLAGNESISESFSSVYNEATITVGVPIVDSNHAIIGSVLLHSPVTGVTETLDRAVRILVLSLLFALFPAIGVGIFYSLLFTRPLKAMTRTALQISGGDYSARTGVDRKDELGQLGNSLDLLAFKLGSTINQLFQEKGKLNDIISSISEGIIAFDTNFNPISVNFALAQIMNRPHPYSMEEVKKDLDDLNIGAHISKVMQEKKPSQVHKDWQGKKLVFTFSLIIDNQDSITGFVALVQDISERERLDQLRREFVANVSHEFRTPLTVIRGSLEAMVDGTVVKSDEIKRYHQRMLTETRGLERLVGDLLELSRLQSGKISMNVERIHIPSLLTDVVKSLQTIADKKGIKLESHSEQDLPPFSGDYDRLRQLLVIFIDNAIKYSPNDTQVSIHISVPTSKTLSISIRDQGYGIDPDQLEQIWDRFYKIDRSRKGNGTGLGLAIAKHLIELQDGKVSVQSEPQKGTIIEISLPLS